MLRFCSFIQRLAHLTFLSVGQSVVYVCGGGPLWTRGKELCFMMHFQLHPIKSSGAHGRQPLFEFLSSIKHSAVFNGSGFVGNGYSME